MMDQVKVEFYFNKLMEEGLGFDMTDPNLRDTPKRVAKMYCKEVFSNSYEEFVDFRSFPNDENYNQIIMLDKIFFSSMCAHHFLPFTGNAWLFYIPDKLLVGASKPSRLVNHYAKRPQIQERLGHEVVEAFDKAINPQGTMLVMRAIHDCMKCRGVGQYAGSGMMTSVVSGCFLTDPFLEVKGLELIKISLSDK